MLGVGFREHEISDLRVFGSNQSRVESELDRISAMAERETTVGPEEGLHARPAAEFVKKAKQFDAEITVVKGDKEANAKSSMKIMTLGAKHGEEVVIRAEGDDAEEAVEALVELISKNEH
jgi:phosphotransferase system HPr (HPr) family protein